MKKLLKLGLVAATLCAITLCACRKEENKSEAKKPATAVDFQQPDSINMQDVAAPKGKVIVVDFFATWCGPCKQLSPYIEKWANTYAKDANFIKVDVDQDQMLAEENDITSIPTVIVYSPDSVEMARIEGFNPEGIEEAIKTAIEKR